jgi:hypothetical protein
MMIKAITIDLGSLNYYSLLGLLVILLREYEDSVTSEYTDDAEALKGSVAAVREHLNTYEMPKEFSIG